MSNPLFTVARQEVDDRDFHHRVAAGLLTHGSTCHAHQHLCSQCGIIDAHIELEELVLRLAGDTLPCQVHAMSHIEQCIHAGHQLHVCLIVDKVRVCLDRKSVV